MKKAIFRSFWLIYDGKPTSSGYQRTFGLNYGQKNQRLRQKNQRLRQKKSRFLFSEMKTVLQIGTLIKPEHADKYAVLKQAYLQRINLIF